MAIQETQENKKELDDVQEKIKQFQMSFAKAMKNLPLDNIASKKVPVRFTTYTKELVQTYLNDPSKYQAELRNVVKQLCITSPQFNMLVEYLPNMGCVNYTVHPIIDKLESVNPKKIQKDFFKIATYLDKLNVPREVSKGLQLNFRYDAFYGYEIEGENFYIKPLNPDLCKISGTDEFGCYTFAFDFQYFKGKEELLETAYPAEFKKLYQQFQREGNDSRWLELDSTKTICTKYFEEELAYTIPPYIGLFSDLYEIEDYKALNKAKVESDNYKLIALEIPLDEKSGQPDKFLLSLEIIDLFNQMLSEQIPEGVGFFPTPMKASEMSFRSSAVAEKDEVQNAIRNLFNKTGFSPLLFGQGENSTSLSYSVKVDEAKLNKLLKQYEQWLRKKVSLNSKGFSADLIHMTEYTKKDTIDQLLKAAQFGVPCKTQLCAALGMSPLKMVSYAVLENDILGLQDLFIPLKSSHTGGENGTDKAGKPKKSDEELGESGQQSREIDAHKG